MADFTFETLEYTRPVIEGAIKRTQELTRAVESAQSYAEVRAAMMENDRLSKHLSTLLSICYIRHTINTKDEFYEAENRFIDENFPLLMPSSVAYNDALAASRFRPEIEAEFGKMLFVGGELQKRSFCEANIPLMQRESALCDEYQSMMAGCEIEFRGETLNLYGIQKHFEDADRETRRRAFAKYSAFYAANEARMEEIWGELIDIRNEMGRNLGFKNYIPLGYLLQGRTDYGVREVESFREQVRDYLVPVCSELFERQRKRLGVPELRVYDEKRIFADGNATPAGDDDFMIARAREIYKELSPETAEFIDFMVEHRLFDLKNRPGKASTGYMTDLPEYRAPFVFSCFNHTTFDAEVLTHEMGHAFAGYEAMRAQPISDYYSESTDIAEIHSMSMEQFCYPYAERFFGADADKYRYGHLQEAVTFVPFGVAVDEFQHICYADPGLTPRERTLEWRKLEQKYMPWRTYDPEDEFMCRGGMWYHKPHIFLSPMYYINYTLTTVGAMEFKKKFALDRAAAWSDYLALCRIGGSKNYLSALETSHLSCPFTPGAVENALSYAVDSLLSHAI